MTLQTGPRVLLGHGTENDFVVLPDPDGTVWPESRLDEARERTVATTRRFVRRQRSWFRRDPQVTWFDAGRDDLADAVTAVIADRTIQP